MALKTLTTARTAIESVKGTAVACTRLLYAADMKWDQKVDTIMPPELRNSYFQNFRAYSGIETNTMSFSGDVTYDDLVFWLTSGVKGGVTGTGASADKTWAFVPEANTDSLKAFTLEAGYSDYAATQSYRFAGVQVDEFDLHWKKDAAVTYDAKCTTFSSAVKITAFTGSLSDRTNVTAVGPLTSVWTDTSTIGTTADTNVISVDFSLKNALTELNTLDGTAYGRGLYRPKARDTQLKVVRYLTSTVPLDAYTAKTEQKIRVKTTGPTLGSSTYSIILDFYGIPSNNVWADVNGFITQEVTYDGIYDSTATCDFSFTVVNAGTAIT